MTSMEIMHERVEDGTLHITMGLTTNIFAPVPAAHAQRAAETVVDEVTAPA